MRWKPISRASADDLEVRISDERDLLLETGGGMVRAEPMIDCDPFFAINSDNSWVDGPSRHLRLLASHWDGEAMDALLLLVPQARAYNHRGARRLSHGPLRPAAAARPVARSRLIVFTGIQMVSKRLLRDAPEGAVLDQYLLGPGHRRGPLLRGRPPGPVVRRRHARPRSGRRSGTRRCLRPRARLGTGRLHHPGASLASRIRWSPA